MKGSEVIKIANEIRQSLIPDGLYYRYESKLIPALKYSNRAQVQNFISLQIQENTLSFISELKKLKGSDFVLEIKRNFTVFCRNKGVNTQNWISYTTTLLQKHFKGLPDAIDAEVFLDDLQGTPLPEVKIISDILQVNNIIAAKLIGYTGNHNSFNTIQPVYYYIKDVLKEHNLTPPEAIEIINDMKGSFSPEWNKNVIPFIIQRLKDMPSQNDQNYSRLDFTKQKLEPVLLELSKSYGYVDLTPYLNELLSKIKTFKDFNFECDFYLNVHYICQEHSKEFWSEGHRAQITSFLKGSSIVTTAFDKTWDFYKSASGKAAKTSANKTPNYIKEKIDPNFWNEKTKALFEYLATNYNATAQKQKYINIWFYLEYHTKDEYVFTYPKEKYKLLVKERFQVDLKKMNKPNNFQSQLIILNNHFSQFVK